MASITPTAGPTNRSTVAHTFADFCGFGQGWFPPIFDIPAGDDRRDLHEHRFRLFAVLRHAGRRSAPGAVSVGGYDAAQLVAFVWIGQGLLATVGLWGDTQLATRIRTGEVVSDLLRPVHPIATYLATDLGRAGFAAMTRFVAPVAVGLIAFDFYLPRHAVDLPAVRASPCWSPSCCRFACRYVVNAMVVLAARRSRPADRLVARARRCSAVSTFRCGSCPARWRGALVGDTVSVAAADAAGHRGRTYVDRRRVRLCRAPSWCGSVLAFCGSAAVQRRGERRLVVNGG